MHLSFLSSFFRIYIYIYFFIIHQMMENSIAMFYLFFCTNDKRYRPRLRPSAAGCPSSFREGAPGSARRRCDAGLSRLGRRRPAGPSRTHLAPRKTLRSLIPESHLLKKKTTRSGSAKGRQIGYDCTQISSSPLAQNNCGEEKKAEMVGTSREGRSWEKGC